MNDFAEQVLSNLLDLFKRGSASIQLDAQIHDGRGASLKGEQDVLRVLTEICDCNEWFANNGLTIYSPNVTNNREWYDFAIQNLPNREEKIFIPANIKITNLKGNDNLNCKLGLFYALTGVIPSDVAIGQSTGWEKYFEVLDTQIRENDKDYYFFVVPKNDKDRSKIDRASTFFTSLRTLKVLTPNGNNLPFQCDWGENNVRIHRNYSAAKNFLLSAFQDSVNKQQTKELFAKYIAKHISRLAAESEA